MHPDIENLLDHSFEYAQELIDHTAEFYPFAAYIDTIGNVHPLEFDYDKKNQPTVEKVLNTLEKYCQTEMSEERMHAYALTYESEVVLEEGAAAKKCVTISVFHKDESDLPTFYMPYSITDDNSVIYEDKFAVKS